MRDIDSMTLDQIEKELAEYRKVPVGGLTVNDAYRIDELNRAAQRIRFGACDFAGLRRFRWRP